MRVLCVILMTSLWAGAQIPAGCDQVVVGLAKDWNSSHVSLRVYERRGKAWIPAGKSWAGRLGRRGLAWGQGIHNQIKSSAPVKKEGDQKAPAGIFLIGGAYGYAASIARHPKLPYRRISECDLWVEDMSSNHYNRHLVLKNPPQTTWEKKAQMRQNDYAHSLKLYIAHNDAILGGKPIPGLGSAIFFHIWRDGGNQPTAGCTTMSEPMLKALIAHLDPEKKPVYVLLPDSEYRRLKSSWNLP